MPITTPRFAGEMPFPDFMSALRSANDQDAILQNDQALAGINQLKLQDYKNQIAAREQASQQWQQYLRHQDGKGMPGELSPSMSDISKAEIPLVTSTIKEINDLQTQAKIFARTDPKGSEQALQRATTLRNDLYRTLKEESERRGKEYDYAINHLSGIDASPNPAETLAIVMPSLRQLFGDNPAVKQLLDAIDTQKGMDGKYIWTPQMQATVKGLAKLTESEKDREDNNRKNAEAEDKARKAKDDHQTALARQDELRAAAQAHRDGISIRREELHWKETHPNEGKPATPLKMTEPEKQAFAQSLIDEHTNLPMSQAMIAATDYDRMIRDYMGNRKMSSDDAEAAARYAISQRIEPKTQVSDGLFHRTTQMDRYDPGRLYLGAKKNPLPVKPGMKESDLKPGLFYETQKGILFWNGKVFLKE